MLLTFTARGLAMPIVAKLDDLGSAAWIALMILGFIFWWPVGLAVLVFTIWSGRMGCWRHHHGYGRWENTERERSGTNWWGERSNWRGPRSSGNRAFDEYRAETLQRLEEEQREFREFLQRLRMAKDKAEFDQFMAERRNRQGPEAPQQA
jgi:hypothetical protein